MTCSQPVRGFRQPIRGCSTLSCNWRDGWSWLSGWVSYNMCTSVYGYTLDKIYDESWFKAIKKWWPYQATSLCCLSTLREYWVYAKVSSDFDLRVICKIVS